MKNIQYLSVRESTYPKFRKSNYPFSFLFSCCFLFLSDFSPNSFTSFFLSFPFLFHNFDLFSWLFIANLCIGFFLDTMHMVCFHMSNKQTKNKNWENSEASDSEQKNTCSQDQSSLQLNWEWRHYWLLLFLLEASLVFRNLLLDLRTQHQHVHTLKRRIHRRRGKRCPHERSNSKQSHRRTLYKHLRNQRLKIQTQSRRQ